jgi:hypothetical protein
MYDYKVARELGLAQECIGTLNLPRAIPTGSINIAGLGLKIYPESVRDRCPSEGRLLRLVLHAKSSYAVLYKGSLLDRLKPRAGPLLPLCKPITEGWP